MVDAAGLLVGPAASGGQARQNLGCKFSNGIADDALSEVWPVFDIAAVAFMIRFTPSWPIVSRSCSSDPGHLIADSTHHRVKVSG